MSKESEMQFRAIQDRASNEESLIEHVQHLKTLSESREFWTHMINDETYSAAHRRIAFVQYFIRHSFRTKIGELGFGSLNLSPFDLKMSVVGLWTGEMPVYAPVDNAVIRITCRFGEAGSTTIYISTFPKTGDSDLRDMLLGVKTDLSQVVTDVAATEQLTSGVYISWKKWQHGQIFEYLPPK